MSHIVTIQCEVRDAEALQNACQRLGLPPAEERSAQLFAQRVSGHCVQLRDWRYPVVCEIATGKLHYDNFSGRWGAQRELDRLLQSYAAEKVKLEARRQGQVVTETALSDGSLKLAIQLGATT